MLEMLDQIPPRRAAWVIFAVMLATILGAWAFERAGYLPCDLCLQQRWAYYAVVPFTLVLAAYNPSWIKPGLWLACAALTASMVFGIYHAGVEYKWWAGPGTCGLGVLSEGLPDLTKPVAKCDEPAIHILGMSLASWNANISAMMAWVAYKGATFAPIYASGHGSSSASQ